VTDDVRGEQALAMIQDTDRARVRRVPAEHLAGRSGLYEAEHSVRNARGDFIRLIDRERVVEHRKDGRARRVAGTDRDICAHKHVEVRTQDAQNLLRRVLDLLAQRAFWKDRNRR
jgi:PAS domain-containing protein